MTFVKSIKENLKAAIELLCGDFLKNFDRKRIKNLEQEPSTKLQYLLRFRTLCMTPIVVL